MNDNLRRYYGNLESGFFVQANRGSALWRAPHAQLSLLPTAEIMRERCATYKNNPPPDDWTGVIVLRDK